MLDKGNAGAHQQSVKDYFTITLAIFLSAVGVYFFKFPNNFSTGGVTGIAVVAAKIIPGLSSTGLSNILNLLLLIVGLLALGRDFGVKTIYGTLLLSGLLFLFERLYPMQAPLTDQPFLELMFAMLLSAVGAALLFSVGASSGGTDVVAMVLKKHSRIYNIGTSLMLVDLIATLSTFFVFDIKTGLFSLFGLIIRGTLLQGTFNAIRQQRFFHIITTDVELIREFIIGKLGRSATVFEGYGAFTKDPRSMIVTVVSSTEAVQLKSYLEKKSPHSFMLITNTSDVVGRGFRKML
ncbi:MAG: YitT family protein [Christensenellales bacterium]|jgi:uncharacterized membrane-anchored protein YitT (DUF2179 family)